MLLWSSGVNMKFDQIKKVIVNFIFTNVFYNFGLIKLFGHLVTVWPLDKNADRRQVVLYKWAWYFFYANNWALLIPTIYAYYKERCYISKLLIVGIELGVITESLLSMILSKTQKHRLQMLLEMSYDFVLSISITNTSMMRHFSRRYVIPMVTIGLCYVVVLTLRVLRAVTASPVEFISHAHYPFDVANFSFVWTVLYTHQVIVMCYTVTILVIDMMVILTIFAVTLKLQLLSFKIKRIEVYSDLVDCVIEHQHLIWLVHEINLAIRFFILKTISILLYYLITLALTLFNTDVSKLTKLQFLFLFLIGLLRLYLFAFSIESMSAWGEILSINVYSSHWYTQTKKMIIAKSVVIFRSQKPLQISIPGLIPSLNMHYVAYFLYKVFSYFMTLRTIISTNK